MGSRRGQVGLFFFPWRNVLLRNTQRSRGGLKQFLGRGGKYRGTFFFSLPPRKQKRKNVVCVYVCTTQSGKHGKVVRLTRLNKWNERKRRKSSVFLFFFFLEYMQRVNFLIIQRKQLAHTKNLLVIPTKVGEKAFSYPRRSRVVGISFVCCALLFFFLN